MDISAPLGGGYPGMFARVGRLLEPVLIDGVELFFNDGWYLTERLYRLNPNPEGWDLLELGFVPLKRGLSTLTEVRLMRKIDPESAPVLSNSVPSSLKYDGLLYTFEGDGGGQGFLIGAGNQYRPLGKSYWVVFQAKVGDVTHLLVYATWDGGSGVYAGRLVPEKTAHIQLAMAANS